MRRDYEQFRKVGAEVVVIAPDGPRSVRSYWERQQLPFPVISDPEHRLAARFGQEVKLMKLGRMPAVIVIDAEGVIRAAWYGESMRDIPDTAAVLAALQSPRAAEGTSA
ncbi:Putative peroxiredoxin bcp [bacterium HR28]|nr:Putative peroxiredoxin bcp [bacterium HR28]